MRFFSIIIFISILNIQACKNKEHHIEMVVPAPELPLDFEDFYDKFHTDSSYQMSHIIFPLQGFPAVTDTSQYVPQDFKWQKDKWILHRSFNSVGGEFKRSFINFNNIITEEISDRSGQFKMLRRFSKMGDDWFLIYYKEMGL